jgi:hypothetical protein
MKNCLTGIPSGAEMIDGIFKLHPQRPRHSSRRAAVIANVECLDLTPSSLPNPLPSSLSAGKVQFQDEHGT